MIKELSHKSNKQTNLNSRSNSKNQTTGVGGMRKNIRNELNINIPNYLLDKASDKNLLNKSNEFSNCNTLEKKTPMSSTGSRVKTTLGKDKGKYDKLFSNTNEGLNIPSIDNEKTLDTTNPTKQTNYKEKNLTNNYFTTNEFNTSPNTKFEYQMENTTNHSGKFNPNCKENPKRINSQNSSYKNKNNQIIHNQNAKNNLMLNENLNDSYGVYNKKTNDKNAYSNSFARSPSNNTLKRSFDTKNKSTMRSKSNKSTGNRNKNGLTTTINKSTVEHTDGNDFQENVMILEKLINQIKSKGFDKYKNMIDEKMKIKKIIEVRVENYQKLLNMKKAEKKYCGEKNSKIECDSEIFQKYAERCIRENPCVNRTLYQLKKEISEMKESYIEKVKETKIIMNNLCEEQQINQVVKDEIKKYNKMNSEVNKEKDSMRNGINLLKKHVEILKNKIEEEKQKSKEFLKNISNFVDGSLK